VAKEFEGKLEIKAGIEINLNRRQSQLDKLNFELINQLDYVLWEYIDSKSNSVTFEELHT
jgi:hypothetical protein